MFNIIRPFAITVSAFAIAITGCQEKEMGADVANVPSPTTTESSSDQNQDLGSISISGSTLSISMTGMLQPNSGLHLNINHKNGPIPGAIRFWVGTQSGEGSIKSKADSHGHHWHAQVQCPNVITDETALWVEIEQRVSGTVAPRRSAKSIPFE